MRPDNLPEFAHSTAPTSQDVPIYRADGPAPDDAQAGSDDARGYIADRPLANAVNVALALGQPLLLTGEPGTGKTKLAWSIAYRLGLGQPLVFSAKTTSTARDLFYRYDAVRHFQAPRDTMTGYAPDTEAFITYEALGFAILRAMDTTLTHDSDDLPPHLLKIASQMPIRSVVLVDEVDKAPRDFPNDILGEVENMSFTIAETGRCFAARAGYRPIVILTSNSEKDLPDAFLRRCVYHHIAFPDNEKLAQIVRARVNLASGADDFNVLRAVALFSRLRMVEDLKKRPATAELIQWVRLLMHRKLSLDDAATEDLVATLPALAKTQRDADAMAREIAGGATEDLDEDD